MCLLQINIFPQSVACLFVLLTGSCAEWKLLILIKSSISIISFMDCAFGVVSKKSSPYPGSFRFSPMLSSRSFIVLHCTFTYVIHVKLSSVKCVASVSRFMCFMCGCPVFPG